MNAQGVIAVPIARTSVEKALAACSEAEQVADWVEVRLDYLQGLGRESLAETVRSFVRSVTKPLIFTYRPVNQGGCASPELGHRMDVWQTIMTTCTQEIRGQRIFWDLELDLVEHLLERRARCLWDRVIASFHAFESLPDVEAVYRRLAATPARILKIAVAVEDVHEVAPLFDLLGRARQEGRALVALAMGMAGVVSRVLGPAWGSLLTYGALSEHERTAPGQLLARHLRSLYRVHNLTRATDVLGVIGKPIGHSLSPLLHNVWLREAGRDAVYLPFEVSDLPTFLREVVRPASRRVPWRVRGISVTLPYKVALCEHLDVIDPVARRVGAVNTILVHRDKLIGYNTDVGGLLKPLLSRCELEGTRAIIVGTGGAARAAAVGLADRGAQVVIVGRSRERAEALARIVNGQASVLDHLPELRGDILVHATPVGMTGYQKSVIIPDETLAAVRLVYDLVYTPVETDLLRRARQVGCDTVSGREMFIHQAAEQFYLWFDSWPSLERARSLMSDLENTPSSSSE